MVAVAAQLVSRICCIRFLKEVGAVQPNDVGTPVADLISSQLIPYADVGAIKLVLDERNVPFTGHTTSIGHGMGTLATIGYTFTYV
jgi:hypothetical protein